MSKRKPKRRPARRKPSPQFVAKRPPPPERQGAAIELPAAMSRRPRRTKAQAEQELSSDYRVVFGSPQGERVKADLMMRANVYHEISGKDLFELGVKEGERRFALHLVKMMGLKSEHFITGAWQTADTINQMMGISA